MAILTAQDLADIRVPYALQLQGCRLSKPCINAVAQAIEDVMRGATVQNAVSTAIDTASGPFGVTLSATEKRLAVKWWLHSLFARDNN